MIAATSAKWKEITGTFIREGYGLSGTLPVLTFNPGFINEFSGSTGLPAPSTDIKLLDDEDRAVAIGERGEVCARGPQVMPGTGSSQRPTPPPSPLTATFAQVTSACSTSGVSCASSTARRT